MGFRGFVYRIRVCRNDWDWEEGLGVQANTDDYKKNRDDCCERHPNIQVATQIWVQIASFDVPGPLLYYRNSRELCMLAVGGRPGHENSTQPLDGRSALRPRERGYKL